MSNIPILIKAHPLVKFKAGFRAFCHFSLQLHAQLVNLRVLLLELNAAKAIE